ncbi:MAG: hypothetical protein K8R92_10480 [Planctomycetes bacterium]|nr:hypothetical protein [Planctomycetota bacterium]
MQFAAALFLATLLFFSTAASAQYARADPFQTSVTQIRKAMSPSESGIQHFRWVSLRLLSDPAMNPLFEALAAQQNVALRVDGYMGIALVSPAKSLDAARVNQLKDPTLRRLLITEALGLELLKPAAIREFLEAPELSNYERTLLVAELNRQGQAWNKSLLESAPADSAAEVAGLASMLLLEQGDTGGWQGLIRKCKELTPEDRTELLKQLANAARQYRIVSAVAPLLEATADSTGADRVAAVTAAVSLAPASGRAAVLEKLKSDRSQSNLVQTGLLMLSAKEGFDAADFDRIRNGDPLLESMANAGAAMRTPSADTGAALTALLENGNRSTSEFVLGITPTLSPALSKPLLLHVLNRVAASKGMRSEDQIVTLLAVQQLLKMPDAHQELLKTTLDSVDHNVELAETILAVVADSSSPEAAAFARLVRGKLPRRGESMAMLALAKSSAPLSAAEIQELGMIASGGGKVDESSQMQAAWLYLKYSKRDKEAIAQIIR